MNANRALREILNRLGQKWTLLVLEILAERPHRYGELRRRLPAHLGVGSGLQETITTLERRGGTGDR
jgi:DNA-binding HxlR family transcriptional regulator